jgi:hypothetical protein
MSTTDRSTSNSHQPHYARPSGATKAAVALVAALVSSTLLGGMLGLFEMRSEAAAFARASMEAQPSTSGLALRKVASTSPG